MNNTRLFSLPGAMCFPFYFFFLIKEGEGEGMGSDYGKMVVNIHSRIAL